MAIYKYQEDIDIILQRCQCPDKIDNNFSQKIVFRYVFEDDTNVKNYCPPLKLNPKRFLERSDLDQCQALGLSLYSSEEAAKRFFANLLETSPNIRKNIGTHIAKGNITNKDGNITIEDHVAHLDLYEFETVILQSKFTKIGEL